VLRNHAEKKLTEEAVRLLVVIWGPGAGLVRNTPPLVSTRLLGVGTAPQHDLFDRNDAAPLVVFRRRLEVRAAGDLVLWDLE